MKDEEVRQKVRHKSVLVDEVLHYLDPGHGKLYIDATFGSGGHTQALLESDSRCKVIAVDWSKNALDTYGTELKEKFGDRLTLVWGNFSLLYRYLKQLKIVYVDGILADFGTSQAQIYTEAGFSLYRDSPLDMRMSKSHVLVTAADVIKRASEKELCDIFWKFGEERHTKEIVREIIRERTKKPIETTQHLVQVIDRVRAVRAAKRKKIHPATRIFQALRIYVNKELDNIVALLAITPTILNTGGRLVCISFHSLEDRLVKRFMKKQENAGVFKILTLRPILPKSKEIEINPASRSARLRAAEKR